MIILGATKHKIKEAFEKLKREKGIDIPTVLVDTLEEAVQVSRKISTSGDVVTLSPACASFDMFPNFAVRGNKFKEIVNILK